MAMAVRAGAMLKCSFGVAPSVLAVLPTNRVLNGAPLATIMDYVPMVNIPPFGVCNCPANPAVVAAGGAAPCTPLIVAPWAPGSPTVTIGGFPALNQSCQCMCTWGGVITVTNPGVTNVMVP